LPREYRTELQRNRAVTQRSWCPSIKSRPTKTARGGGVPLDSAICFFLMGSLLPSNPTAAAERQEAAGGRRQRQRQRRSPLAGRGCGQGTAQMQWLLILLGGFDLIECSLPFAVAGRRAQQPPPAAAPAGRRSSPSGPHCTAVASHDLSCHSYSCYPFSPSPALPPSLSISATFCYLRRA